MSSTAPHFLRRHWPVAAALLLCACHKPAEPAAPSSSQITVIDRTAPKLPPWQTVVARVNGAPIYEDEVDYWFRAAHGEKLTAEMKEAALDKIIDQELVFQDGMKMGLDDEHYHERIRGLELQLNQLKRSEMSAVVMRHKFEWNLNVTEQEAHDYFIAHHDDIQTRIHLRIWRFSSEAQAKADLAKLRAGTPADVSPFDPGPTEWLKVPVEWRNFVFALKPGEISDVFEGPRAGIRVFQLIGRDTAPPIRFADIKATLIAQLKEEKINAARASYVTALRQAATIKRSSIEQ